MMVTNTNIGKLGRLGNSLFQIAAVVGYAKLHNMDWRIPRWEFSKYFRIGFNEYDIAPRMSIYREPRYAFTKIPKFNNVDLFGYFQSERYFNHCRHEIKKLFSPNDEIAAILAKSQIEPDTCAIHVRRTDYLNLPDYHNNLPLGYYTRAMDSMKAARYVVFSDDIEWCKANILGENVSYQNSGNDILDFFIMRSCDRFIIANSSYSFWSSYLSEREGKRIIAPQKDQWFGGKYRHNDVNDLYLTSWELI